MTSPNADAARNVTKYTGQNYKFTPSYVRSRDPTSHDIRDPLNQGYYPFTALWINKTNQNLWTLVKIASNLATWILLGNGSSGPAVMFPVPHGTSPVVADASGNVTLTSLANTVVITGSTNSINFDVTGGFAPVEKFAVPNGTTPVSPDGTGTVTYTSTAGTVVITGSPNTINFDITGGSTAIEKVNLQSGTTPIVPAAGAITFNGATVAAGTHPVRTDGTGASTMALEVQISQALSATDATKIGLTNFDSKYFTTDANGFTSFISPLQPGATNLGIAYAAGTFTIEGASGTTLSAANPAYVTVQNVTTPGLLKTISVTANQSFTDAAGTGNLNGNLFGTTAAIAWGNDCPFYLYAVYGSPSAVDTIIFGISRVPHLTTSPVAGKLAKTGSAVASSQGSMFLFNAPSSVADFASKPVVLLGSFRMQKSSSDNWTVQTLSISDGINQFQESINFTYPQHQNGASAGTNFIQDGNAPTWTNKSATYKIFKEGLCDYILLYSVISANGSTATAWVPTIPIAPSPSTNKPVGGYIFTAATTPPFMFIQINADSTSGPLYVTSLTHTLQEGDVTSADGGASAQFNICFTYPISIT